MKRAALFDFDGTLCPGDSIVPFLRYCVREGAAPASQWLRAVRGYLRQRRDPSQTVRAKEETLSFIAGRGTGEMDALARHFLEQAILPRIDETVMAELEDLRRDGVRIVILSASPDIYMRLMPEYLPVDQVIATRCETADGRYTGKIGANCKGEEKVARWRQANAENGYEVCRAYGDSPSDLPMLRLAAEPVWVNAGRRTRELLPGARVLRTR